MSSITITVPLDYFALTRASDMLHGMALDLDKEGKRQARRSDAETASSEAEKDAAAVFGGAPGKSPSPSLFADSATDPGSSTETGTSAPAPVEPEEPASPNAAPAAEPAPAAASSGPAPADTPAAPAGVELDSDGLPWDPRIHSGSKGKLAKTKQWKKKRGVDPALVEQVEAELKAAMSASPANPVEPSAEAHTPTPAPAPASPASPAPAPAPSGVITTFPALMQKITAQGVPQADVTAAVNKQGLQALPLLAARPDLIPAVAATLFGS